MLTAGGTEDRLPLRLRATSHLVTTGKSLPLPEFLNLSVYV